MPPKETTKTKKWRQADRVLPNLTNRQLVDITNTTYPNINQVGDLHFWHRDKRNFRHNFRDLEIEYSGA